MMPASSRRTRLALSGALAALIGLAGGARAAAQAVHPSAWSLDQLHALQVAQDYLDQHRADLGLGPTDAPRPKTVTLQNDSVVRGTLARIVYEPQAYKGLVVKDARIDVVILTFSTPKIPTYINAGGHWVQNLTISEKPMITSDEAHLKIIGTQLGAWGVPPFAITHELVVAADAGPSHPYSASEFHLAWKVSVANGPMRWFVYVDAQDGSIVKREAQFILGA